VAPYLAIVVPLQTLEFVLDLLIRHSLTNFAWRPLVEITRRRHLRFRRRLTSSNVASRQIGICAVISAGV
jgi:hypothetical protein